MRVFAETARSRFSGEEAVSDTRFVRRRVSGAMVTLKVVGVKAVMVRQVPFTLMLSPRWASERISAQSTIVREVPPPPVSVSSCFSRMETAGWG